MCATDIILWFFFSVQNFVEFLRNACLRTPNCDILYGRHQTTVQAFLHRRDLSCKEGSSTDLLGRASGEEVEVGRNAISAGDYEAQGHVSSLRTVFAVTASKRSAAST